MDRTGTYEIKPARHARPGRWVVTVGPNWHSQPMPLAHLRVYVRALRDMRHRRRFPDVKTPARDQYYHDVSILARASGITFAQACQAFDQMRRSLHETIRTPVPTRTP
jgi:hypothetical protein